MNHCPNCGALLGNNQDRCSICNTTINTTQPNNEQINNSVQINSLYNNVEQINNVYQPIIENQSHDTNISENVTEGNNVNRSKDEIKKNIMTDILKEHEEKTKKVEKDDSYKAGILSIIVVIIIVVGGYFGVKYGLTSINNGEARIIESVKKQAESYSTIIKNYMKKYNYKLDKSNQSSYVTRTTTYNYFSIPLSGKCVLDNGKWIGSDNDEVSCEKFFNDINNNYCHNQSCDIPSAAELYLKEIYVTENIDGIDETITAGTISNGSTLTYDDVICTLVNDNYNCKYLK